MSKGKNNPVVACGAVETDGERKLEISNGTMGPSILQKGNILAGMEIKTYPYTITIGEGGNIVRIENGRTIGEIIDQRINTKIMKALNAEKEEKEKAR